MSLSLEQLKAIVEKVKAAAVHPDNGFYRLEIPASYARYVGADYETVQWGVDDGSAAHEPEPAELRPPLEHEGKALHWVLDTNARAISEIAKWDSEDRLWRLISEEDACWSPLTNYRYLGPAEWKPVAADVAKRLDAEIERLRALLSRVEDAPAADGPSAAPTIQADIDRTIDHLVKGQTTQQQRKDLATATERAERDAAVGRALR